MALLGESALAMWWDMAPDTRTEFEHWHSHEHFPERLALPGFLRASRWSAADGGEGFFILYELQDHAALSSPEYLARLNAPTPWSTRLMPHHRNMVRSLCEVRATWGGGVPHTLATIRFSTSSNLPDLARRKGLTAMHLLQALPPAATPQTAEQKIRGGDATAEWVLLIGGYDREAIEQACSQVAGGVVGLYRPAYSLSAGELA
jgi:hypothetical protein